MYNVQIASLKLRQQELKEALKAKYEEINKIDSGAGKVLIAEFGSILINGVANGAGVPLKLKIPPKFYTAFLPPFISVFLIPRDLKKKKALLSDFEALTEDYNKVVAELADLEGKELLEPEQPVDNSNTGGNKKTGTQTGLSSFFGLGGQNDNTDTNSQQPYLLYFVILIVLILLFIYWKRRQV